MWLAFGFHGHKINKLRNKKEGQEGAGGKKARASALFFFFPLLFLIFSLWLHLWPLDVPGLGIML